MNPHPTVSKVLPIFPSILEAARIMIHNPDLPYYPAEFYKEPLRNQVSVRQNIILSLIASHFRKDPRFTGYDYRVFDEWLWSLSEVDLMNICIGPEDEMVDLSLQCPKAPESKYHLTYILEDFYDIINEHDASHTRRNRP